MTDDIFKKKHREFCDFVKTSKIQCGDLWEEVRPIFMTDLRFCADESKNPRGYFAYPGVTKPIGAADNFKYMFVSLLEKMISKLKSVLISDDLRSKVVYERYSGCRTGYSLEDHPLFGRDKCKHNTSLYNQWNSYVLFYNYVKELERPALLEIGAGSGIFAMLCHYELNAKYFIVDLPEMITFSSRCIHDTLPNASILFPNEIKEGVDLGNYDFVYFLPDQISMIGTDLMDAAINIASFGEMSYEEVDRYFDLIHRVVKDSGYFFCSNRLKKETDFLKYKWRKSNEDIYIDINEFRDEQREFNSKVLLIDRIQRVRKTPIISPSK